MTLSFGICSALLICGPFVQEQEAGNEFPKPSPEHAILKNDVGNWDVQIAMSFEGQEMKSKGTEVVKMIGPFWNVSDMKYDYMGMPMHGHAIMGYDPEKKKYIGSYHESSSPHITTMEGTFDAKTNKLTMLMKGKSPDGKNTRFKSIVTYINKDKKTFEFFMLKPGSETDFMKNMTMTYTRAKAKKKAASK